MISFVCFDFCSSSDSLLPATSQVVENIILSHDPVLENMCRLYKDLGNHKLSVPIDYNCRILLGLVEPLN
jgi:hypothetical protein